MTAEIFDIQRFSLHDGPGIRTTVFFKGCPLKCKWCHNPESQTSETQLMYFENNCVNCGKCLSENCKARIFDKNIIVYRENCVFCGNCVNICPGKANKIVGKVLDTNEIIKKVSADKIFYGSNGGLTLSGGEPSMQSEASLELISLAKQTGINTVIETCGFGDKNFFIEAKNMGVTFYYDIKVLDDKKHKKFCGASNKVILENLELLFSNNADIVIRLPLIPGINDTDEDLNALKLFLCEHKSGYIKAEIMKYHNLGITKVKALNKTYEMSLNNADELNVKRWLDILDASNNNVDVS